MAQQQFIVNYNLSGIDLNTNPLVYGFDQTLIAQDGKVIRAVNVKSTPLGAKSVREGYTTFLGTTQNQGSQVNTLFQWLNGASNYLYSYAGSVLSYYDVVAGTATDWLPTGNGTFSGTHIGRSVLNGVLIVGDGVGSTRHTTNGTSFTNTSGAPSCEFFEEYQNRIYAGTGNILNYSVTNDATNWQTSGTSDSSFVPLYGAGTINKLFKNSNLLYVTKSYGQIYQWDGQTLYDMTTNQGPSSPYSLGTVDDNVFYLNRLGIHLVNSNGPQLISTPVVRYFYNQANTGVGGTAWGTAPGFVYRYDYYIAVGSVRDDLTDEPLNNAVLNYNFQKNEFLAYQYNDAPTSFSSYLDNTGSSQYLFGNSTGQVFRTSGTASSDNGQPISSVLDMLFTANQPHMQKDWRWIWVFMNPGCEAQVQVAISETFTKGRKRWIDIGQAVQGVIRYRFPTGSRSRLLYVRIKDSSRTQSWTCYGIALSHIPVDPG